MNRVIVGDIVRGMESDEAWVVARVSAEACTIVPLRAATDASLIADPAARAGERLVLRARETAGGGRFEANLDRLGSAPIGSLRVAGAVDDDSVDRLLRAMTKLFAGVHSDRFHPAVRTFDPGRTPVPASGKVVGRPEVQSMIDASMDAWLTTGRFNDAFERRLAAHVGVDHALTVNSGSSANLVAFATLTSPRLGDRAIVPGDEVITVAAGFPTTVNPILQMGAVPVFVDVDIPTYNIDVARLEAARSERTKAVVLAHTLGNPFDVRAVADFARRHGLWLVEDCCDALGSTYDGRRVGTFGDLATLSFYPAHHITMGEGGAVLTSSDELRSIATSFRDWGRDCWCAPGCDNTCGRRFGWTLGGLPSGYDHKYVYSHVGWNLKISDMQAACGLAQLDRLEGFVESRRRNFGFLSERLRSVEEFLVLPRATPRADPSWFGFPLTLREAAGSRRVDLLEYLGQYGIGTRLLFAGNLTRQPSMSGRHYRVSGTLENSDRVMNDTFWIGVHPGLDEAMLDFAAGRIEAYFGLDF